jgi:hypothetical protein
MTPNLALFLIALKFFAGFVVGLGVVALVYRTRFIRGAIFGGIAFVLVSGLAGWADSHAYFLNGKRVSPAPWVEDLRLRNFLAENETVLEVTSSCGAALQAGIGGRRRRTSDERPA